MKDQDAATQLIEAFDSLSGRLDRALKASNTSSVVFNAGGIAPWIPTAIALFCAGVIFGSVAIGGFWAAREFTKAESERAELRRTDLDLSDYISAAYQISPEFQKRIEAEQAKADK